MSRMHSLLIGARFARAGGREGLWRTALIAIGVGLGFAALLVACSVPAALDARKERGDARSPSGSVTAPATGELVAQCVTVFGGRTVTGTLLQPQSPRAALPPGLSVFPAPGDMAVSPALARLLNSDRGQVLRERLDHRITATIGDTGLRDPQELVYYAGADHLDPDAAGVSRIDAWGAASDRDPLSPQLLLLVVVAVVALLTPVTVFIATAVRTGGERQERRLAALRLIGADRRAIAWIASGEALAATAAGLTTGALLFIAGRQLAGHLPLFGIAAFPADLQPDPSAAAGAALGVSALAVSVTLLSLRGVVVEPLGVARRATATRRRLAWRLALPAAGTALVAVQVGTGGFADEEAWIGAGVALVLGGITALLPWLVENATARLGKTRRLSRQLAVRRLQHHGGTAARSVTGVMVVVAGAIALHTLFVAVGTQHSHGSGDDLTHAQLVMVPSHIDPTVDDAALARAVAASPGTRSSATLSEAYARAEPTGTQEQPIDVTIGDCQALRLRVVAEDCHDGDTLWVPDGARQSADLPGRRVLLTATSYDAGTGSPWTIPSHLRTVDSRPDPHHGTRHSGLFITPGALHGSPVHGAFTLTYILLDPDLPNALDQVRTAAKDDPAVGFLELRATETDPAFAGIRKAILAGAALTVLMAGAGLLVSVLEQLREQRRVLSALAAIGAPRSLLAASVLWQTLIPVSFALLLATGTGTSLGMLLVRQGDTTVPVDWTAVAVLAGTAAATVLLVTLLSLPLLWRLMRADGLHTE
ncbi:FtsX-like permease family protein [Kitasatospora herbaricolor]|uniref:FtsX-like permease family protein n=1 Tax=Kitasatospora herbaricolor TaxID=68217 RepID=UPI0036DEB871